MSLHLKFRNWVTLCVAFPTAVLLLVVNFTMWNGLQTKQDRDLMLENKEFHSEMEGILLAEKTRLRSLSNLPITLSLVKSIERNRGSWSIRKRKEANAKIEETWASLERTDIQIRNILDNSVGELFGHLSESDSITTEILLTDSSGALVASSKRTPIYDQSAEPWWQNAREATTDNIIAEGIDAEGGIGLTLAVWGDYETKVLEGMLHARLSLQDFDLAKSSEEGIEKIATLLVGNNTWFVRGNPQVSAEANPHVQNMTFKSTGHTEWSRGFRYIVAELDGGLQWQEPLYAVTLKKEARLPLSILLPQTISLVASAALLYCLVFFSNKAGRQMFFQPLEHLIDAGAWVMDRAQRGDATPIMKLPEEFLPQKDGDGQPNRVTRELDEWISGIKQEMHDTVYAQTYEVQKDMELARDFQMAYLNRPYPKIPANHIEGRLRLSFSHRYEPALALGGDFFDFVTLADDCAGIFVADVMGHGTRSALITAILRTLIGDLSQQGRNARHFMTEINNQFCELLESVPSPQFASSFYFVADTTGRVATYSSAGHHAPYLLRRSANRISRLEIPQPHGAALGIIPGEEYSGGHTRLIDGDIFLFFTDGFHEASNRAGEEFGASRMEALLRKMTYRSADEILDALMKEVKDFAGEQPIADDICLVAVEVTSKADHSGS